MREQKIAIKKEALIGEKLKDLKLYSPEKYKDFVKSSGYSPRSFLRWENGKSGMNKIFIEKLAAEYGAEYGDMVKFLTDKNFGIGKLFKSDKKYSVISECSVALNGCFYVCAAEAVKEKPRGFSAAKDKRPATKNRPKKKTAAERKEERREIVAMVLFMLYVAVFSCVTMYMVFDAALFGERSLSENLIVVVAIFFVGTAAILIAICRKRISAFFKAVRRSDEKRME